MQDVLDPLERLLQQEVMFAPFSGQLVIDWP